MNAFYIFGLVLCFIGGWIIGDSVTNQWIGLNVLVGIISIAIGFYICVREAGE